MLVLLMYPRLRQAGRNLPTTIAPDWEDSAHMVARHKGFACYKRIPGLEGFCLGRSIGHKEFACNKGINLPGHRGEVSTDDQTVKVKNTATDT